MQRRHVAFGCCWCSATSIMQPCNHQETDARIIRHAIQSNDFNPLVVVASDTDCLVLLIYDIDRLSLVNIPHRVPASLPQHHRVRENFVPILSWES